MLIQLPGIAFWMWNVNLSGCWLLDTAYLHKEKRWCCVAGDQGGQEGNSISALPHKHYERCQVVAFTSLKGEALPRSDMNSRRCPWLQLIYTPCLTKRKWKARKPLYTALYQYIIFSLLSSSSPICTFSILLGESECNFLALIHISFPIWSSLKTNIMHEYYTYNMKILTSYRWMCSLWWLIKYAELEIRMVMMSAPREWATSS